MAYRNPARFLAPLALVASVALVIVVVGAAGKHPTAPAGAAKPAAVHTHPHRIYRVHTGDTLSSVSVHTRVPLTRLEQLNPAIDPNALRPGQRIKLR
jgi:LysM repeat protein